MDLQAEREAAGDGQRRRTNIVRARSCGQQKGELAAMSELSTGKMNPQALGWNKRLRIGAAAPSRTPLVRLDRVIVGLVSFLELLELENCFYR